MPPPLPGNSLSLPVPSFVMLNLRKLCEEAGLLRALVDDKPTAPPTGKVETFVSARRWNISCFLKFHVPQLMWSATNLNTQLAWPRAWLLGKWPCASRLPRSMSCGAVLPPALFRLVGAMPVRSGMKRPRFSWLRKSRAGAPPNRKAPTGITWRGTMSIPQRQSGLENLSALEKVNKELQSNDWWAPSSSTVSIPWVGGWGI